VIGARRTAVLFCALACACTGAPPAPAPQWTEAEKALLGSLRLSALRDPPPDFGNAHGDDPRAAELGAALFADPALSRNGQISCQTCHRPELAFSDGLARSVGLAALPRNAPSLLDVAYQRWLFWDGRADSLWSQALAPLEEANEMGGSRIAIVSRVAADPQLARRYEGVFGPLPAIRGDEVPEADRAALTRAFANLGKAIAAYERTLRSRPSRFDVYVDALLAGREREAARSLDAGEIAGLRVFLSGRSGCLACHNGPHFSDGAFHNIGTGEIGTPAEDLGRARGRQLVRNAEFNCASPLRDGPAAPNCGMPDGGFGSEVRSLQRGAFRTPGLRNLSATAPYLHDGRYSTLEQVLEYYRHPADKVAVAHELPRALDLSDRELADLARFLRALDPR
jgi:cytochrome c peroxidase